MPTRIWSHLCEYATVDMNGRASIFGEFNKIFVQNIPAKHPIFFVITKWGGYPNEEFTHQTKFISPSGKVLVATREIKTKIRESVNSEGFHIIIDSFVMVDIPEYGEYAIDIIVNGTPTYIMPLIIAQRHNPTVNNR